VRASTPDERRWIEQWRAAGPALAALRRRELREMSDEQALAAAESLLALAAVLPLDPKPSERSGLVAQQALLHRRR
jgi:hypothetical protein